jgi:hypothetical protein
MLLGARALNFGELTLSCDRTPPQEVDDASYHPAGACANRTRRFRYRTLRTRPQLAATVFPRLSARSTGVTRHCHFPGSPEVTPTVVTCARALVQQSVHSYA